MRRSEASRVTARFASEVPSASDNPALGQRATISSTQGGVNEIALFGLVARVVAFGRRGVREPAPFNETGVTMGHWHLASQNAEANKKIFLGMGGELIKRGDAESVRFPGVRSI